MAFQWIYFLVLIAGAAVPQRVQAATQLRLVNGLLIIEDRHPLEVSSSQSSRATVSSSPINSSGSQSINNSTGGRSALRESRDNDLHGHGILNRNRSNAVRSSRRLLKDAQGSTTSTTTTVRTYFIERIVEEDPPAASATIVVRDNSIDESKIIVEESNSVNLFRTPESTSQPQEPSGKQTILEPDTSKTVTEKEEADKPVETRDNSNQDPQIDTKSTSTHETAVNSVTTPTMDVITIVWYFSTFIALVAFFVVMVCSDKYCTRGATKPEDTVITAPATPAPSYREFAPPSYDSVMKKYKSRVFIIPMLNESGELKSPDEATAAAVATVIESSQSHLVHVEVQKPVQQVQTAVAAATVEENSQSKDSAETAIQNKPAAATNATEDQLMVVVVLNEMDESKMGAGGEDNLSR